LENHLKRNFSGSISLAKLNDRKHKLIKDVLRLNGQQRVEAYLGIDVGSLSTNVAIIDKNNNVLSRRYLPTAGKPLEAIKKGLSEVGEEIGHRIEIKGVGTTGSGRYLTGDFVGADTIQNEITAQATAAIKIDPEVDTIFEIGGQDSKYISIKNGVIVDFEMNKVCAAGTGSFLEEQADKLGINIKKEFGEKGLAAEHPAKLGERCTVFIESDLNSHQQNGTPKDNLIAGLAYSIVHNYLNRVVRDKPIGNKIFFQGGVTNNKAVLAAFEEVTGKPIHVPPHFDITGAIGAAILARRSMNGEASRFRGFEVSKTNYETDNFVCKSCSNHCEIKQVKIEGESKPLFYGGICDKYEFDDRKKAASNLPNLIEEREHMLLGEFVNQEDKEKISIGIPRGLMNYYQLFPFWRTFFGELGFNLVISDKSDKNIITTSLETMVSETCLPVELIHGHVLNLIEKNVDYVFLPFVVNAKGAGNNPTNNCNCPWVQSHPYLVKAAFTDQEISDKLLIPSLHFRYFERALKKELQQFFTEKFNLPKNRVIKAIDLADKKQQAFERDIKLKGKKVLDNLDASQWNIVIIGRPYNTSDPALNLRLVKKLENMNVLSVPLDFLPLEEEHIFEDYPGMYWPNGQKILQASRYVAKTKNLFAIYLSNFRCGPDSFLLHFVQNEMNGKPFMHLEVDEHSADAGMITRVEAFLDSLKGWRANQKEQTIINPKLNGRKNDDAEDLNLRTIYYPYSRDHVYVLAAATRGCGIPSEVLPMQDKEDIELGRKYTNGQECFPFIATLGSFLKKLQEPENDASKSSFFMPDHNGPCRFGEYNKLHRIIFDKLGYTDAKIVHPSNEDAYASIAPGYSIKWRKNVWKGLVAADLLRKMQEQIRPYETKVGHANALYEKYFQETLLAIEKNCKGLTGILAKAANEFKSIPVKDLGSKPIVVIVGEIFMRDNPYCSNFLVERLEKLGAETVMAPFAEWINYSTLRFIRDSRWKGNIKNIFKAKIQLFFQKVMEKRITNSIKSVFDLAREIEVEEMLENCGEFIHKDYDGDPPLAIGSAVLLAGKQISGVVNILPFTCMPGTINCTVSNRLRKKHGGLPWENFAYDGHNNIGMDTRFEAFIHQVKEYHKRQKEQALS